MVEYKIVLPKRIIRQVAPIQLRVLAFLIDVLLFFFLIYSPFFSLYAYFAGVPLDLVTFDMLIVNNNLFMFMLIGSMAVEFLFFFYLVSSEYLLGCTLGKRFLNLSVVNADTHDKPGLLSVIIRNLSKSLFLPFFLFDVLPAFFDLRKRRILDFVSGTIVVENKKIIKRFPAVDTI